MLNSTYKPFLFKQYKTEGFPKYNSRPLKMRGNRLQNTEKLNEREGRDIKQVIADHF